MDGYLVMLCHSMDDIPVALCESKEEAEAIASERGWDLTEDERRIFGIDCDSPAVIKIVQFVDGKPIASDHVRFGETGPNNP